MIAATMTTKTRTSFQEKFFNDLISFLLFLCLLIYGLICITRKPHRICQMVKAKLYAEHGEIPCAVYIQFSESTTYQIRWGQELAQLI